MTRDDVAARRTYCPGGLDELTLLQRQDLAANHAGHPHPAEDREQEDDEPDRRFVADDRGQPRHCSDRIAHDEQRHEEGKGEEEVRHAHHDVVESPTSKARNRTDDATQRDGDDRAEKTNHKGDSDAIDQSAVEVTADVVRTEPRDRLWR